MDFIQNLLANRQLLGLLAGAFALAAAVILIGGMIAHRWRHGRRVHVAVHDDHDVHEEGGEHAPHFHQCKFKKGHGLAWLFFARIGWPLAAAAILIWQGAERGSPQLIIWAAVPALLVLLYVKYILRDVSENTYAVPSRVNRIMPVTKGEGLHEAIPGDEYFQIAINPIVVLVEVTRQLLDHRVATLRQEVTLFPEPRIADEKEVNAFGRWVIEGAQHGDEHEAEHHVDAAIKKALAGLLGQLISQLTSDELNAMQFAIALLVESEISLHVPLHRDQEARERIEGRAGCPTPELGDVIRWYHKHQRRVREELDRRAREFNNDLTEPIDPSALSHHEAHVGCVFERVEITGLAYDAATTAARAGVDVATHQAKAAAPLFEAVSGMVKELTDADVGPDAALGAAMALAKQGAFSGTVFAGSGDLAKTGVLGTVLGETLEKGKEKKGGH